MTSGCLRYFQFLLLDGWVVTLVRLRYVHSQQLIALISHASRIVGGWWRWTARVEMHHGSLLLLLGKHSKVEG